MSPEYYRHRAEECCLNAIRAEDIERRLHWLEAAARWLLLARQHPGPYKPGFPCSRLGAMFTGGNAADNQAQLSLRYGEWRL
jgi:hypothetical protein